MSDQLIEAVAAEDTESIRQLLASGADVTCNNEWEIVYAAICSREDGTRRVSSLICSYSYYVLQSKGLNISLGFSSNYRCFNSEEKRRPR